MKPLVKKPDLPLCVTPIEFNRSSLFLYDTCMGLIRNTDQQIILSAGLVWIVQDVPSSICTYRDQLRMRDLFTLSTRVPADKLSGYCNTALGNRFPYCSVD